MTWCQVVPGSAIVSNLIRRIESRKSQERSRFWTEHHPLVAGDTTQKFHDDSIEGYVLTYLRDVQDYVLDTENKNSAFTGALIPLIWYGVGGSSSTRRSFLFREPTLTWLCIIFYYGPIPLIVGLKGALVSGGFALTASTVSNKKTHQRLYWWYLRATYQQSTCLFSFFYNKIHKYIARLFKEVVLNHTIVNFLYVQFFKL